MAKRSAKATTTRATPPPAALSIEQWSIDRPIAYSANPRKNADAVAKVAASLNEFGWRQPIVVDTQDVVIVGHTRLLAAQSLGYDTVPVHVATDLTPAQARAYRLADNRTAQEAEWDDALLMEELAALGAEEFDLELTGFDADEIDKLKGGESPGDPDGSPGLGEVRYQVIVDVQGEHAQADLVEELEERGFQCRLLTL